MKYKKSCVNVVFRNGRILHVDEEYANYIFGKAEMTNEERRNEFLAFYHDMAPTETEYYKHIIEARGSSYSVISDKSIVEDCLFKDVDEFGENRICSDMADMRRTLNIIDCMT